MIGVTGTSGEDFWLRSIDAQGKGFGVAVKPRDRSSFGVWW